MKKVLIFSVIVLFIGLSFNHSYLESNAQTKPLLLPTPCDDINVPCPFPTPQVISVIFEQANSTLDCNPKFGSPTLCDGKRIFPDKDNPNDMLNKKIVKVTATLNIPTNLAKIAFKTFDVDDPDTNMIIDPNGVLGNDNRGNPQAGTLSFDSTSPGTSDTIVVGTDENGKASVYLTTTMQPGDNFVVAASAGSSYLESVTVNGTGLKHITDGPLPNTKAKITEMLTVWRRLHIEVDSMKSVTETTALANNVTGTIPSAINIGQGNTTLTVSTANPLEPNRFENGRLVIGGVPFRVVSYIPPAVANTATTVTIRNKNAPVAVSAGQSFILYDDDDFNNDDGENVDGDAGNEDIPDPDMSFLTDGSDNATTNILAPAYIKTVRVTAAEGDTHDNSIFKANLPSYNQTEMRTLLTDYDLTTGNTNNQFWTAYVLGSYQSILNRDNDPHQEPHPAGVADSITGTSPSSDDDGEGSVAFIFLEINRTKEIEGYNAFPERKMNTYVAHEIGHLLGCQHGEGDIMGEIVNGDNDGSPTSIKFSATSLNIIRNAKHP
jgi:hypothetical protein